MILPGDLLEAARAIFMLHESTKNLLQSILDSLEAGHDVRWDDLTESGSTCLYEMHQMSRPLYKAYTSDSSTTGGVVQRSFPEKVNRAIPHVRMMVIAIRHKAQTRALESARAALAELNGSSPSEASGSYKEPPTDRAAGRRVIAETARTRGATVRAARTTETLKPATSRKSVRKTEA